MLDLFGASQLPRQVLTFGKGAWRFKEDLLHTIVAQDDDHEIDMVALLHQTSADGFTYGGFLRNGDSVMPTQDEWLFAKPFAQRSKLRATAANFADA